MTGNKYEYLLNNKDVKRWCEGVRRGSVITADVNIRRIGKFTEITGKNPWDMLEMNQKNLTDLIDGFITEMEKHGFAPNYISSTLKAVKSWLAHNNVTLGRKIKISNTNDTPSLKNERIPTQDELKRILASGDPRSRAACILMAHAGLRPEVLGDYLGNDGLKISDLPEMKIDNGIVSFKVIPTMITIRTELSKTRKQYFSFIGQEGCFYIKAYIEERIQEGETITPDSPLIVPSKLALRTRSIRTINIGDIVRASLRKAGFPWRPYVLRSFFDTQLMMAESKGLILRDYRQFFMGHVGDIEHRYTINKRILPDTVIEEMRSSYGKALRFLETEERGIKEEDSIKIQWETAIFIMETAFRMKLTDEQKEELSSLDIADLQK